MNAHTSRNRPLWMRRAALVCAAGIGLILGAACASTAPASAPATPAVVATNADGSQITETQQGLANAVTNQLVDLGLINPESVTATLDGPLVIIAVQVEQIAASGSVEGLPVGSLLVVDTTQTSDIDSLTTADVLTLTIDGALADSLHGLPDDVVARVMAGLQDPDSWRLTYRNGRAEVKTTDGGLAAFADESTGDNWRPGEVLTDAVGQVDGWQFDPDTNTWVGGSVTGGPEVTADVPEATAIPATEKPPTATPVVPTATNQPGPTEVPTAVPTEVATEVESPEHAQAMENIRQWMSGMEVPDEWRFRNFFGDFEQYGRLVETVVDRSIDPIELYLGTILGWTKISESGDVIVYIGFRDAVGENFAMPLRIGNNSTAMNIPVVDSISNSSAGSNDDTHVFVPPEEVGRILGTIVGRQILFFIRISDAGITPERLEKIPPEYWGEIKNQFAAAQAFDSVMEKIANGTKFSDLSPEERKLFDTQSIRTRTLPMIMQVIR